MECLVARFIVMILREFGVNSPRIKVISVKVLEMDRIWSRYGGRSVVFCGGDMVVRIRRIFLMDRRIDVEPVGSLMTSNNVTFIASFIPLIMEYLMKINKKARILELKQRHLKKLTLTSYTPYPLRKIRRICACTSQETTKEYRSIRRIQKESIRRTMAGVDVDTLTMEQYLALSRENQAPGVVKPEIRGNVNFKIKSQFMRELREDTFSRNKNEDAHDHIDWSRKKMDNLGRDMKKLKESVHAIQVGCQICEGPLLDKDCPINEEVKQVEEVRYGEFRRTTPFNGNNGGKFHVGPPGYYTKTNNRPPYGERRQSLEELLAKHQEESARRSTEMEVWIKKLQENAEINTRNQRASLKNLETQIE
ncbi:hypothetical protein Tco_0200606 [Tanacetum coccineum]